MLINVGTGQIDIITKLENGVMVSESKTIKLIQAQWTLLISITPPALINVEPYLEMLMNQIATLERENGKMNPVLRHNLQYLTAMNQRLSLPLKSTDETRFNSIPRHRRALFDLGGKILHHLFGTATDEDVQKCQQAINYAMTRQETIVHNYQAMTTVVQAIQNNTIENRDVMKSLSDTINQISFNMTGLMQRIRRIRVELWINQFIEAIDMYISENLRSQDQYYQKRSDLELGTLTEHILPKTVLLRLLSKIKDSHFQPLPWTWYYENIVIQPMWQVDQTLVYTARLPFVSIDNYLMYYIQTFPVGVNMTSLKIIAEPFVAMDSVTNGLFLPQKCQGREPIVCTSGPITRRPLFNCEYGIVTGHSDSIHDCLVDIQPHSKLPEIYSVPHADGHYVIHTNTDDITLNCPGNPSRSFLVSDGTYLIQVPAKCHINSEDWTLSNIYFGQEKVNVASETLKVNILNSSLLNDITNITHEIIKMPPKLRTLKNIKALTVPSLHEDEMDSHFIKIVDKHQSKILIIIIIIIIFIVIVGIMYYVKQQGYHLKLYERMKMRSITATSETTASNIQLTNPINSLSSLTPSCPNLYPIMPVLTEGIALPTTQSVANITTDNTSRE